MIHALLLILGCQLAGEAAAQALSLPLPGPVLGLILLLGLFSLIPATLETIRPLATGILANLSLLFVPAGVGVVGHLERLGTSGGPLMLAIVVSTVLSIAVGALTFTAIARLTGTAEEEAAE